MLRDDMPSFVTVTYGTERVGTMFEERAGDEDLALERIDLDLRGLVDGRPGAVYAEGTLKIEAEDKARRAVHVEWLGIGAGAMSHVVIIEHIWTSWHARARAFVDVRPEHMARLEHLRLSDGTHDVRLAVQRHPRVQWGTTTGASTATPA